MQKQDYLELLVENIHSTTIATIGADGHPQTRVIDMMLSDEQGVYFLTAKGKAFYAIVNAANSGMTGCYIPNHRCIDNAIHTFAGVELRLACAELMEQQGYPEPTGRAKITPAFNLPCRYVLHTVGPIIDGRVTKADKELLASCYRSCLALAAENGLESVAFCCVSTGEFHFPNDLAAQIAVETVKQFMNRKTSVKKVIFNVFKDLDKAIYEKLLRAA